MRKTILITMAAIFAVGIMAQQKMRVWKNNSLAYEEDVTQIDSITFYNEYEGALNGEFSVSPTKKVRFSKGNLQYQASTDTWRFAENQYEYMGYENANISSTYSGWIDLFGWGTGNNPTESSTSDSDYSTFVDWGPAINNNWFTLSIDEWEYLLHSRPNANILYGVACVNGVNGCILLPDNCLLPQDINFNTGTYALDGEYYFAYKNNYSVDDFLKLESIGAVFLPAAGCRIGNVLYNMQGRGSYWSSTPFDSDHADDFDIRSNIVSTEDTDNNRLYGQSVRLVVEIK